MKTGSCMCGAVRFTVSCELKPPDACHCVQCRKFSGHYSVGTDVPKSAVEISGAENLTWYQINDGLPQYQRIPQAEP